MSAVETKPAELLTAAYVEVCHSYERIDDFRAKLLGLLPLVSGTGLLLLLRSQPGQMDSHDEALLAVAGVFGIVVTVGLLFYELRGVQRCNRLVAVGKQLERQMEVSGRFLTWPTSIGPHVINEPVAAALIYSAVLGSWTFLVGRAVALTVAIVASVAVFTVSASAVYAFYRHVKET